MRMRFSIQQFCWAFTNAFRPIASHKDAVVQEETAWFKNSHFWVTQAQEILPAF